MKKLPGGKKCCFLVHVSAGMGFWEQKDCTTLVSPAWGGMWSQSDETRVSCYSTAFFPACKLGMQLILGLIPVET